MSIQPNSTGNRTLSFLVAQIGDYGAFLASALTYYSAVCVVVGFFANFEIVLTFYRRPSLVTPFSVHMLILSIVNLLAALTCYPIRMLHNMNIELFRGNRALCSAQKYVIWINLSMCSWQHFIICCDRWLAILCPIWYRGKTIKFGIFCSLTVFVVLHLLFMPIFVTDAVLTVFPDEFCDSMRTFVVYQQVARPMISILPEAMMMLSYPVLLALICIRKRKRIAPNDGNRCNQAKIPKGMNEFYSAMTAVGLQVAVWIPYAMLAILGYLQSPGLVRLQFDLVMVSYLLPSGLLITDPMINLIFMANLRREVLLHLKVIPAMARQLRAKSINSGTASKAPDIAIEHVIPLPTTK